MLQVTGYIVHQVHIYKMMCFLNSAIQLQYAIYKGYIQKLCTYIGYKMDLKLLQQ